MRATSFQYLFAGHKCFVSGRLSKTGLLSDPDIPGRILYENLYPEVALRYLCLTSYAYEYPSDSSFIIQLARMFKLHLSVHNIWLP